jgi:hypothetical protein
MCCTRILQSIAVISQHVVISGRSSMDQAPPDRVIAQRTTAEDTVCSSPCSGAVIVMSAAEWSQFALGQLLALGIATFILTLVVIVLSVCLLIE